MRMRRRTSRRRYDRVTLELASMIDVTFLLLIFFLVSTVLADPEDRLRPTLQTQRESASGSMSDFQPQIIRVLALDGGPAYKLGSNVYRKRAALADAIARFPTDLGVFVEVDDGVPVGFAVAAIQVARDAGFDKVTYVPSRN